MLISQLYIPSQLSLLMWFATAQYKNMVQYVFVLPLNHCVETAWAGNGMYMYIRTFQRDSIIIPTWPHPIFLVNMQTFVCSVFHDRWSNTVLSNLWSISLDHNPSRRCTKLLIENCSTDEVRVKICLDFEWHIRICFHIYSFKLVRLNQLLWAVVLASGHVET